MSNISIPPISYVAIPAEDSSHADGSCPQAVLSRPARSFPIRTCSYPAFCSIQLRSFPWPLPISKASQPPGFRYFPPAPRSSGKNTVRPHGRPAPSGVRGLSPPASGPRFLRKEYTEDWTRLIEASFYPFKQIAEDQLCLQFHPLLFLSAVSRASGEISAPTPRTPGFLPKRLSRIQPLPVHISRILMPGLNSRSVSSTRHSVSKRGTTHGNPPEIHIP